MKALIIIMVIVALALLLMLIIKVDENEQKVKDIIKNELAINNAMEKVLDDTIKDKQDIQTFLNQAQNTLKKSLALAESVYKSHMEFEKEFIKIKEMIEKN